MPTAVPVAAARAGGGSTAVAVPVSVAMAVASGHGSHTEAEENKGGQDAQPATQLAGTAQAHILGGGSATDDWGYGGRKRAGYDSGTGWGCKDWSEGHGADHKRTGGRRASEGWNHGWSWSVKMEAKAWPIRLPSAPFDPTGSVKNEAKA